MCRIENKFNCVIYVIIRRNVLFWYSYLKYLLKMIFMIYRNFSFFCLEKGEEIWFLGIIGLVV